MTQKTGQLRDLSTALNSPFPTGSGDADALSRIAAALEVLAGTSRPVMPDWTAPAYIWHAASRSLRPAAQFQPLDLALLQGTGQQAGQLESNTRQFATGLSANNALLWGARGTGKSSLVKALFAQVRNQVNDKLHLIEIHKEDLRDLPLLTDLLATADERRFIIFLDDLSFDVADDRYKNLKSALEGGLSGQPRNLLIYATSNRRHLLPRDFSENDRLHPAETAEENISLSDRFGLWLGFYAYDQATYLQMVASYVRAFKIPAEESEWRPQALEWAITRGARSGRVAWQFIRDLAGRKNVPLDDILEK